MRKGGYILIDMNGFDFATTPSSPNINIYNNLNTNFNKVLLISNWYVNGVLMNDVFTTLISTDNGYQFTIHTEDTDYTYGINNKGYVTITTKSNHLYDVYIQDISGVNDMFTIHLQSPIPLTQENLIEYIKKVYGNNPIYTTQFSPKFLDDIGDTTFSYYYKVQLNEDAQLVLYWYDYDWSSLEISNESLSLGNFTINNYKIY